MDWQNILGVAAIIVAVGSISGVGLMRDRLANLNASNDELRSRMADVEKERNEDRAKLAEVVAENKILTTMVQGRVDWGAISDLLEEHHREAIKHWADLVLRLDQIHSDLTGGS